DPQPELSSLAEMERERIEQAIIDERGNMSRVAARLGISRQTLYNKIKRYGL
ncbi:MAG: sigma-54-dependent Fis family transcriptional regulator, partial [Muribaculaceae bacterium]|nr:sigma-54-dependent Fis family transcriptional regulator [Muribaculaceae bacterium]